MTASMAPDRSGVADAETGPITGTVSDLVHVDPRYVALRSRHRRFVLTATALFLSWYGLFVGLSAFAPDLMGTPVLGSVNLGILIGLAQFVTTLVIVDAYGRFARREMDPRVRRLRDSYVAGPVRSHTSWIG